jgi:hypothetical protein
LKIDTDRGKEKAAFGRRKTPEEEEGKGKETLTGGPHMSATRRGKTGGDWVRDASARAGWAGGCGLGSAHAGADAGGGSGPLRQAGELGCGRKTAREKKKNSFPFSFLIFQNHFSKDFQIQFEFD